MATVKLDPEFGTEEVPDQCEGGCGCGPAHILDCHGPAPVPPDG